MPINSFITQGAFEPEATAVMGEAFDAACKELRDVGQLQMVRKIVAQRIIAAARRGELDPIRLRASALRTFVTTSESDCAFALCGDVTRVSGIPVMALRRYVGRHDRHASDSAKMGVRRLEAR